MRLRIARIRRRRRGLSHSIIGYGLGQDRGDIGPGFSVPLEPGIHLVFGAGPFALRRSLREPRKDLREPLGWRRLLLGGNWRHSATQSTRNAMSVRTITLHAAEQLHGVRRLL